MKIDRKKSVIKISESKNIRIGIVVSNFNKTITDKLLKGAKLALKENGVKEKSIQVIRAPGAFEIPVIAKGMIQKWNIDNKIHGIITLGCIIKGETAHFEYISSSVSNALCLLSVKESIPVGFGILTCYNEKQARDRCKTNPITSEGNKGYETAIAVLETIDKLKEEELPF